MVRMIGFKKYVSIDHLGKQYAKSNVYDVHDEVHYQVKRGGISLAMRKAAAIVGEVISGSAASIAGAASFVTETVTGLIVGPEIASTLAWVAGGLSGSMAGIAVVGFAGAVSAGFAQYDYDHQRKNLRKLYEDEIGVKLGKKPENVTVKDLVKEAETNPILAEELARASRQRNFAIPMTIAATIVSFAVTKLLFPAAPPILSMGLMDAGMFALKIAVSMATYAAVKTPLHALGKHLFNLHQDTVNDRIVDIQRMHGRGHAVTPEQLMDVFVAARPELGNELAEQFGRAYATFNAEEKKVAVQYLEGPEPLAKLAAGINDSTIDATELAFAAVGDYSIVGKVVPVLLQKPDAADNEFKPIFQERVASKKRVADSYVKSLRRSDADNAIGAAIS